MIKRNVGVKNFFVRGKSVKFKDKGLFNYLKYLENEEHQNHKGKTEKIERVQSNRKKFYLETMEKVKEKEFDTKNRGKRGREIGSYRFSYCFSFPTDLTEKELTKDKLNEIMKILINDFSAALGMETNQLLKEIFINIHYNDNIHINLVVNKVINNKVIDLSKRKYLTILKKSFNYRNLKVLGLDKNDYKPKQKKREFKHSNIYLNNLINSLNEKYNIEEKLENKKIKNFITYLNRYINKKNLTEEEKKKNPKHFEEVEKLKRYMKKIIENYSENETISNDLENLYNLAT